MIWFLFALAALAALAPLLFALMRPATERARRDAALDLFRAQRAELDRDLADGRIGATEHATAVQEVERRVLAEASRPVEATRASNAPLVALLAVLPALAALLYLISVPAPGLPGQPLALREAEAKREAAKAEALAARLRAKIATLDPHSDLARQGDMLLGNLEDTRGDLHAAADAWAAALAIRFDPTLAAELAEARTRLEGKVSPESADLFRRALAASPATVPWRAVAEARLASVAAATPAAAPVAR